MKVSTYTNNMAEQWEYLRKRKIGTSFWQATKYEHKMKPNPLFTISKRSK